MNRQGEYYLLFTFYFVHNPSVIFVQCEINQFEFTMTFPFLLSNELHIHRIFVEDGGLLLRRPCDAKVIKGPCLTTTIPGKFRLFLLDDLELGSSGASFSFGFV